MIVCCYLPALPYSLAGIMAQILQLRVEKGCGVLQVCVVFFF